MEFSRGGLLINEKMNMNKKKKKKERRQKSSKIQAWRDEKKVVVQRR